MEALVKLDAISKTPEVYVSNLDTVPDRQPESWNYASMIKEVADLKRYRFESEQTLSKLAVDIFNLQDIQQSYDKKLNAVVNADQPGRSKADTTEPKAAVNTGASTSTATSQVAEASPDRQQPPPQQQQAPTTETNTATASYSEAAQQPPQTPPRQQSTSTNQAQGYISLRPQGGWPSHPSIPSRPQAGKQKTPAGRAQQQRSGRAQQQPSNHSNSTPSRRSSVRSSWQQEPSILDRHTPQQANGAWTKVVSRKQGRKRVIGNANNTSTELRGAQQPPTRDIFVSRVEIGNRDTMKEWIQSKGINVYAIEKMSNYHAKFKSFKVKISLFDLEKVFDEKFWPYNIQCMMFKNARTNNNNNNVNNRNAPH